MILLNYVLSIEDVPSISLREVLVDSRLITSFALYMLVFVNKSLIYLCCDKKRHFVVGITSMPKKKCSWPMLFRENQMPRCSIIDETKELFPIITKSSTYTKN